MKCPHCGKAFKAPLAPKLKLQRKQERFAQAYVRNSGNGTQAARDAGYSQKGQNCETTSARLLRNSKVRQRIDELSVPLWELAEDALRDLVKDVGNANARARAVEILAKLEGRFAPVKHDHRHMVLVGDLRGPETAEELRHMTTQVLRSLPPGERRALLDDVMREEPDLLPPPLDSDGEESAVHASP